MWAGLPVRAATGSTCRPAPPIVQGAASVQTLRRGDTENFCHPPFLLSRWRLQFGDADCPGKAGTTADV